MIPPGGSTTPEPGIIRPNDIPMTAEVAILNRETIALAADSASTVSLGDSKKIYSKANKIIPISMDHPVAVMIYGNAQMLDTSWELLIRDYAQKLGSRKYDRLADYGHDFIDYIKAENLFISRDAQFEFAKQKINFLIDGMLYIIDRRISQLFYKRKQLDTQDIVLMVDKLIDQLNRNWTEGKLGVEDPRNLDPELRSDLLKYAEMTIDNWFSKFPLSPDMRRRLLDLCIHVFLYFPRRPFNHSHVAGIVFVGFGEGEASPSYQDYWIDGKMFNQLKYKLNDEYQIDVQHAVGIFPFAQSDMVHLYLEGIHPELRRKMRNHQIELIEELPKKLVQELPATMDPGERNLILMRFNQILRAEFQQYNKEIRNDQWQLVDPVLKTLNFLPKEDMAELAESLISLTCMRKRISHELEDVGAPVDVAVITKIDNFQWIKNKNA